MEYTVYVPKEIDEVTRFLENQELELKKVIEK